MTGVARFSVSFYGTDPSAIFSACRELAASEELRDKFLDGITRHDEDDCTVSVVAESSDELLEMLAIAKRAMGVDVSVHARVQSEIANSSASLSSRRRGEPLGKIDPVGSRHETEIREQVKEIKRGLERHKALAMASKGGT